MAEIWNERARKAFVSGTATATISGYVNRGGPYGIRIEGERSNGEATVCYVYLNDIELADMIRYWLNNEANASANVFNSFLSTT